MTRTASPVIEQPTIHELHHVLAAANHFQWSRWAALVLPELRRGSTDVVRLLSTGGSIPKLDSLMASDARMTLGLVQNVLGEFPLPVPERDIEARKREQFRSWLQYAAQGGPAEHKRWLRQMSTPFVGLSVEELKSDYAEASRDLSFVADTVGIELHYSPPTIRTYSPRELRALRLSHRLKHGKFYVSVGRASFACVACGKRREVEPPPL